MTLFEGNNYKVYYNVSRYIIECSQAVVERILQHWQSLTTVFQKKTMNDNLPRARSVLNALNNQEYKIYLLFLSYVLELRST